MNLQPEVKPTPLDLLSLERARLAGIASQRCGFTATTNMYAGEKRRERELRDWAFGLGWREAAWLYAGERENVPAKASK